MQTASAIDLRKSSKMWILLSNFVSDFEMTLSLCVCDVERKFAAGIQESRSNISSIQLK